MAVYVILRLRPVVEGEAPALTVDTQALIPLEERAHECLAGISHVVLLALKISVSLLGQWNVKAPLSFPFFLRSGKTHVAFAFPPFPIIQQIMAALCFA